MSFLFKIFFGIVQRCYHFIIVFVVIFTIFSAAFGKRELLKIWAGFFVRISSIIYAPFVNLAKFFKNLIYSLDKQKIMSPDIPHYMARKFVLILEVVFIIGFVGITSGTLITAWKEFLPPEYLRQLEDRLVTSLKEFKESNKSLKADVDAYNSKWQTEKNELIKKYKENAEKSYRTEFEEYKKIGIQISEQTGNIKNVYINVKDSLMKYEKISNNELLNSFRDRLYDHIYYNYDLGYYEKETLLQYFNGWYNYYYKKNNLSSMSEELLRSMIQPELGNCLSTIESNNYNIERIEADLQSVKNEMRYNYKEFFLSLLEGFIYLLIFMWVFSLLIDFLSIGLKISETVFGINKIMQKN